MNFSGSSGNGEYCAYNETTAPISADCFKHIALRQACPSNYKGSFTPCARRGGLIYQTRLIRLKGNQQVLLHHHARSQIGPRAIWTHKLARSGTIPRGEVLHFWDLPPELSMFDLPPELSMF